MSQGNGSSNGTTTRPLTPSANGDGRDPKTGLFVQGWKGGRGNPHYARLAKNRSVILSEISEEELRIVIRKMCEQAQSGCVASAKVLFEYCIGKPQKVVDADNVDGDELARLQAGPTREQLQALLVTLLSPAVVATFLRELLQGCHATFAAELSTFSPDLAAAFKQAAGLTDKGSDHA